MKNLFADRLTCALNLTLVEGEAGEGQRSPASSVNKQGRCRVILSNVFSSFIMKRSPKLSGTAFKKRRKEEEEKLAQSRGM